MDLLGILLLQIRTLTPWCATWIVVLLEILFPYFAPTLHGTFSVIYRPFVPTALLLESLIPGRTTFLE
jgi:hypothetical protein